MKNLSPADMGKLDSVEQSLSRAIMLLQEVSGGQDPEVSAKLQTAVNEASSSLKVVKVVKEENEPQDGS